MFTSGILIPTKIIFCIEYNDKTLCDECINQFNVNKDFEANKNELKRKAPFEFGHRILYIEERIFFKFSYLFVSDILFFSSVYLIYVRFFSPRV